MRLNRQLQRTLQYFCNNQCYLQRLESSSKFYPKILKFMFVLHHDRDSFKTLCWKT